REAHSEHPEARRSGCVPRDALGCAGCRAAQWPDNPRAEVVGRFPGWYDAEHAISAPSLSRLSIQHSEPRQLWSGLARAGESIAEGSPNIGDFLQRSIPARPGSHYPKEESTRQIHFQKNCILEEVQLKKNASQTGAFLA